MALTGGFVVVDKTRPSRLRA